MGGVYEIEESRFVRFFEPYLGSAEAATNLAALCVVRDNVLGDDEPATRYIHPIAAALVYETLERILQAELVKEPDDLRLFMLAVAADRLHAAYLGVKQRYIDSGEVPHVESTTIESSRRRFSEFFTDFCPSSALGPISTCVKRNGQPDLGLSLRYLWYLRSKVAHEGPRWKKVAWSFGWVEPKLPKELTDPGLEFQDPVPLSDLQQAVVRGSVGLLLRAMDDLCRNTSECWGHKL